MGQEGYGAAMHAVEDLADEDLLTESVTKYAERATLAEEHIAQMEAKLEEQFTMISMQQLTHPTYYQKLPPPMPHT